MKIPQYPRLSLRIALAERVRGGHPWVYREALAPHLPLPQGALVSICANGEVLAHGLYDAQSPIAVRVCSADAAQSLDDEWVAGRVQVALSLRRAVWPDHTTALRLIHGEGDGLPGVVCDLYGPLAVLQLDTSAAERFLPAVVGALQRGVPGLEAVLSLHKRRKGPHGPPRWLWGEPVATPLAVRERGMTLWADPLAGQKTGLFLDQRDNRALCRTLAAGKQVLNLYAYTGGFSVAAALGGARRVVSVDLAAPALEAAAANFRLNGLDPAAHEFAAADAVAWLASCAESFDSVVLDPPSMAPSKASLGPALSVYRKLHALALGRVAPGGLLLTASCSSHVEEGHLLAAASKGAAEVGRRLRILHRLGAGADHPVPPGFPEGRYLKGFLFHVE